MSSTYGENLKLSIFGQSHGPAIGMVLDGIPAGLPVDEEALNAFLTRRAPGQNSWSTPRKEGDAPEFLGGILDGFTCGAPIAAVIHNTGSRSGDYENLKNCPRPGHADYTAQIKYGGFQDAAGGGHFSGRLTAPLCIAGGLCKQWLEEMGIHVKSHIYRIGGIGDDYIDAVNPHLEDLDEVFPVINRQSGQLMQQTIARAKKQGDSVGGIVECVVTGLPAGIGEPMFGGVESRLAQILYGIPAVKAVEFGMGVDAAALPGSVNNDAYAVKDGRIVTVTNRSGGILGGITNGMPVILRVAIKPTPSIAQIQQTVDLTSGSVTELQVQGRHDPCIVPRAVPVVEAAVAIAVYDMILGNTQAKRRK